MSRNTVQNWESGPSTLPGTLGDACNPNTGHRDGGGTVADLGAPSATDDLGVPDGDGGVVVTAPRCGDGTVDPGEQCDPTGPPCPQGTCQADCTCPCDFLDPSDCLYPFPSDYLTIADPTTDSGRRVHLRRVLGQGEDHPEILTIPETSYLKGAVLQAD